MELMDESLFLYIAKTAGKEGGKAKPLKKPKATKDYDEDDKEFLKKKKEEEAALKKAREALLKGKKNAYLTAQTYARPPTSPAQRIFTLAFAGGFAALGIARAIV
ncbi:hypothetical protein NADE_006507 [Nannochloris sp. 'desiccata']|nr:hypothetical protein KSW81_008380 [Chlorella desiccata (nom. nud.)]KAH7619676.1 hypothetical protein NADE_006507 [Chlorella desiccata (nom. nud.)]